MANGHANTLHLVSNRRGFTIVELLIVVVVIAILAAITIVAYNGIQNRAKTTATQSAVSQASKKVHAFAIQNSDQYPANLTAFLAEINNPSNSGNTTYQYSVDNLSSPKSFCITATTSNLSYYQSSTVTSPTLGGCAGHSVNGASAITNLIPNPSFEAASVSPWTLEPNVSTAFDTTTGVTSGTRSLRITKIAAGSPGNAISIDIPLVAGTTYTLSYTVVQGTPTGNYNVGLRDANGATYIAGLSAGTFITPPSTPTRYSVSGTALTTGNGRLYVRTGSGAIGDALVIDAIMLTTGTASPNYADGNSPGWTWTGTINGSTSTGFPL